MKKSILFKSIFAGALALSTFSAQAGMFNLGSAIIGSYATTAALGAYHGTKQPAKFTELSPPFDRLYRQHLIADSSECLAISALAYLLGSLGSELATFTLKSKPIKRRFMKSLSVASFLGGLCTLYSGAQGFGQLGAYYANQPSVK